MIDLIRDYHQGKLSDATTYEGKQRQQRIRGRMKRVVIFYGIALAVTIILFCADVYHRTFVEPVIAKNEMETIKQTSLFDEVQFGRVEALELNERSLPITWIVVEKCEDSALLLSKYALFESYFYKHHKERSYAMSNVRKTLNDDFLYYFFRKKELEHVIPGDSTGDRAFLLSESEVEKYLPNANLRKLTLLEMSAKINENNIYKDKSYWWWLRPENMEEKLLYAPVVDWDGSIKEKGIEVNRSNGKVRPAIWVHLN